MTKNAKRVRLTDDAIDDLRRLHRKDPRIVRDLFAKMLLLERASDAGEPLVGALVGFRKLVVGDRSWRIVWRETTDVRNNPVLDISEIWAAGAREDGEIYSEMKRRVERRGRQDIRRRNRSPRCWSTWAGCTAIFLRLPNPPNLPDCRIGSSGDFGRSCTCRWRK